jgi:hypothetical protein
VGGLGVFAYRSESTLRMNPVDSIHFCNYAGPQHFCHLRGLLRVGARNRAGGLAWEVTPSLPVLLWPPQTSVPHLYYVTAVTARAKRPSVDRPAESPAATAELTRTKRCSRSAARLSRLSLRAARCCDAAVKQTVPLNGGPVQKWQIKTRVRGCTFTGSVSYFTGVKALRRCHRACV